MSQPQVFFCFALVLAGFGLFHWEAVVARKLGLLCFWAASGLGMWFLTGLWSATTMTLAVWVLFPVSEVIFVLRKLRLPRRRTLQGALPPVEEFGDLRELTREMEALGFVRVDDCDLTPAVHHQFYRLLKHSEERIHAAIGYVSHRGVGFSFVSFTSEDVAGKLWVTWDYPLTYGLKMPPQVAVYRDMEAETLEELLAGHRAFLEVNQRTQEQLLSAADAEAVRSRLERTLDRQFEYNLSIGILAPETKGAETFRYSWRGAFYVVSQVLFDLVRL